MTTLEAQAMWQDVQLACLAAYRQLVAGGDIDGAREVERAYNEIIDNIVIEYPQVLARERIIRVK